MIKVSDVLNPEFINAIEFEERPYFIKFKQYPGLRVKVNPKGRISFITYGRIHFGGSPRTITHGTTNELSIDKALDKHFQCLKLLQQGLDPNLIKKSKSKQFTSSMNFLNVANDFIKDKIAKKEYSHNFATHSSKYLLNNKLKYFHKINIAQISEEKVKAWYNQEKTTPAARHNALRLMSSVFSYAGTQNIVEKSLNPTSTIFKNGLSYQPKSKDVQLTLDNELPKFIYQMWDPLNTNKVDRLSRNAIYFMLFTGIKKSDVLNMKWSQISGNSYILIEKRSYRQMLPITPSIELLLKDIKDHQSKNKHLIGNEYLFFNINTGKPINNLRKTLVKYSNDLDWIVYPEAIRKTFAKVCDYSSIPREHFYQLLGIKKAYNPYQSHPDNKDDINQLKKSLITVQDNIDKAAPMLIPGQLTKISDFIF
tara:strand:+ start:1608 stop:2876 length:1269 start_codon:yes stop_codon:yes gene_type:complete